MTAPCIENVDLATAARLQRVLLPPSPLAHGEWVAAHHFAPAGAVGGDILDLIPVGDRLYFVFADVSGKGVGASLVSAYLHAIFRSLAPAGLALEDLVARASALLCSTTLSWQYATLVAGYLDPNGEIELANAGHPPPLVLTAGQQAHVVPTGTPVGMFCDSTFGTLKLTLAVGDTLLMYSDGISETLADDGQDYGTRRLLEVASNAATATPFDLVGLVADDHARIAGADVTRDDVTLLAVRRQAGASVVRRSVDSRCAVVSDRGNSSDTGTAPSLPSIVDER
jgi:sigma-B regulation protein RsbU (phosphoserine phosphatase)